MPLLVCIVRKTDEGYTAYFGGYWATGATEEEATIRLRHKILQALTGAHRFDVS